MAQQNLHRSAVSNRLAPFGSTIFSTMTRLAHEHGAVNLSQGFPDEDGPALAIEAVHRALCNNHNQYARSFGEPVLNEAIAAHWSRYGANADPTSEITVTSGCTEAIAATMLGLINPGDEVILFEPYYDSYRATIAMAGGTPRFVTLREPNGDENNASPTARPYTFNKSDLRAAFTSRTRAIMVNTPHNPTGKVFTREELALIASLCQQHNVIAITDEVYERLLYDDSSRPHVPLATLPGMRERTITLSSLGKTFSFTGWKIGWAIAPPELTAAVRAAHQFLTFATATPLQYGAAALLSQGEEFVKSMVLELRSKRDLLAGALADIGFRVYLPEGSYFIVANHTPFGFDTDIAFCQHLIEHIGVAAIPTSVFYSDPGRGQHLVRFAFCKKQETLDQAIDRLRALSPR